MTKEEKDLEALKLLPEFSKMTILVAIYICIKEEEKRGVGREEEEREVRDTSTYPAAGWTPGLMMLCLYPFERT